MTTTHIDLNIRAESVQQVYDWYHAGRLIVNRRYQRKLVWKKEEKEKLMDTLIRNYPMPLILIANYEDSSGRFYEIIDGMQRLDAIFSFIENKYDFNGKYFDTSIMATSHVAAEEGEIIPKLENKLDIDLCKAIANYKIPISEYKIADTGTIDEVFRRINSSGRVLSRQEIRQAGVVGKFSDVVRDLATSIRGDVSHTDIISLNDMAQISLSSGDLDYGIDTNEIFWVKNGVISKDGIRESKDESLIADLVANILLEKPIYSSEAMTDGFYGRRDLSGEEEISETLKNNLDLEVNQYGEHLVRARFLKVFDIIKGLCAMKDVSFRDLIGMDNVRHSVTRYYSAVFWVFHDIVNNDNKKVSDYKGLIESMSNIGKTVNVKTGNNWAAYIKQLNIDVVSGLVVKYFEDDVENPATKTGKTEFENIVMKSKTEACSYDFKQGLYILDQACSPSEKSFMKIINTICAIANEGPNNIGYIILGVCDKSEDAERIKTLHGSGSIKVGDYYVTGIDHEINTRFSGKIDSYVHSLSDRIRNSKISAPVRDEAAVSIQSLKYEDKSVVLIKVRSSDDVCYVGDDCYYRSANRTEEAKVADMKMIFNRFK